MESFSLARSNSESVVDEQEVSEVYFLRLWVLLQKLIHGAALGPIFVLIVR
jgi:hypothetical protein